jgi:hypothetical protein
MPVFNRLFYNRYRREAMSNVAGRLLMVVSARVPT